MKVMACAVAALVTFIAGGVWGYHKGTSAGMYMSADAYFTVTVLRQLREGKVDQATALLEPHLDGQIATVGVCEDANRSWLNLLGYTALGAHTDRAHASLMADVAKYRERHPSQLTHEQGRQFLRSTLEKYTAAAEHDATDGADAAGDSEGREE